MNKNRKSLVFTLAVVIVILIMFVAILNRKQYYPTNIDTKYSLASGIDFSAKFEDKSLACTIVNHNNSEMIYGEAYYLEKLMKGKWYEVVDAMGERASKKSWIAIANSIPANGKKELTISLDDFRKLKQGKYRIVIPLGGEVMSKNIIIANFQVGK